MSVERLMKRHLRHLVVRAIATLARMRFTFRAGNLTRAAKGFEVRDEIAGFLPRTAGSPIEEPGIGRHDRLGHHRSRRKQMREMPILRATARRSRQIRTNPPRAPQVRIVEAPLPRKRRRTKARHVGVEIPDLLRVAIGAALSAYTTRPRRALSLIPSAFAGDIAADCASSTRFGQMPSSVTDITKKRTPATLATR